MDLNLLTAITIIIALAFIGIGRIRQHDSILSGNMRYRELMKTKRKSFYLNCQNGKTSIS